MSWPVEKILEEASKLDAKDRALVVAELSSSEGIASPEEVEAAWREEIARRGAALASSRTLAKRKPGYWLERIR